MLRTVIIQDNDIIFLFDHIIKCYDFRDELHISSPFTMVLNVTIFFLLFST